MSFWQNEKYRSWLYQIVFISAVFFLIKEAISNVQWNLEKQNIASGFGFLNQQAGFDIGEALIAYTSESSYGKAFLVGLFNTIQVAIVGNLFAVFLGVLLGVLSLSKNWLVAKLCRSYIEIFRNTPLLLQLFFWYAVTTETLPPVREAYSFFDMIFISNRGVFFPWFSAGAWSFPVLEGFNFSGGNYISPEFLTLLLGLSLYTGAFNGEIVRAGIESIPKGQWEAGESLGLKWSTCLYFIILPQSLRLILPPLTSQLLNLTKNSSLAVAIGYPELVNVSNTVLNQTGQAVEVIFLMMLVYLSLSLLTSLFMNLYNERIRLREERA